jgi:diguanylate cyclase (GGDEF)-like protein
MDTTTQLGAGVSSEPLARDEQRIGRIAWVSISIAIALAGWAGIFLVLTEANQLWQYITYPILVSLPVLFGIVLARYTHATHVDLLRGYQARLVLRTIDLEKMASHDELTELYNRRYFYERFLEELRRSRVSRQTLALVVLDIDGLKKINDEYGHAVGDIVITNLARVINKHIRNNDVPARMGGDEFAVLMPDTDKRGAYALAQRLWEELEEIPMYEHEGLRLLLNVSIGVSGYPWGGEDVDEMMHWADADMYANKVGRRLPQSATSAPNQTLTDDLGPEDPSWM